MNILDLILTRRTIHSFATDTVSKEIIEKAVLAGIHAPNHKQTWPWRFYNLKYETRLALGKLDAQIKAKSSATPTSDAAIKSFEHKFMEHGAILVLGLKRTEMPKQAREDYASVACAVQNMSLYLASEGYGTKWSTGKITTLDDTYELLKIDQSEIEIVGFLWIGKAKAEPPMPVRPDLDTFLFEI
ncbi:MAG: nitroreductase [Bdellovibrionales bacterium]|nr:nitroreductase [Bdellovibrionales bacterium]